MLAAILYAVHARHTARHIDCMLLGVDAHALAILCAFAAAVALGGVDNRAEKGEFRHKSQHRTHRANGVAPQAAPAERHEADDH